MKAIMETIKMGDSNDIDYCHLIDQEFTEFSIVSSAVWLSILAIYHKEFQSGEESHLQPLSSQKQKSC